MAWRLPGPTLGLGRQPEPAVRPQGSLLLLDSSRSRIGDGPPTASTRTGYCRQSVDGQPPDPNCPSRQRTRPAAEGLSPPTLRPSLPILQLVSRLPFAKLHRVEGWMSADLDSRPPHLAAPKQPLISLTKPGVGRCGLPVVRGKALALTTYGPVDANSVTRSTNPTRLAVRTRFSRRLRHPSHRTPNFHGVARLQTARARHSVSFLVGRRTRPPIHSHRARTCRGFLGHRAVPRGLRHVRSTAIQG